MCMYFDSYWFILIFYLKKGHTKMICNRDFSYIKKKFCEIIFDNPKFPPNCTLLDLSKMSSTNFSFCFLYFITFIITNNIKFWNISIPRIYLTKFWQDFSNFNYNFNCFWRSLKIPNIARILWWILWPQADWTIFCQCFTTSGFWNE